MKTLFSATVIAAALSASPTTAAYAAVIAPWQLEETDFFSWQGQFNTPTWRDLLAAYDCTPTLTTYFWTTPTPPITIDPPPYINPPPPISTSVPETSTWLMTLLGFIGLGYISLGIRQRNRYIEL